MNIQNSTTIHHTHVHNNVLGVRPNRAAKFRVVAILDPTMQQNATVAEAPTRTLLGDVTAPCRSPRLPIAGFKVAASTQAACYSYTSDA